MNGNSNHLKLLEKAWQVRQAFFPQRIEFVDPSATLPVSVTQDRCALNCAHCNAHYLKHMATLERALKLPFKEESSFLVSGGCDLSGRVPLVENWDGLKELKKKGPLNLHTGLVPEEEAERLGAIADVVSFDFPGEEETVAQVYGLKAGLAHYLKAYRALLKVARVVPHICIGLKGGKIKDEEKILEALRFEAVEALSFIVLRPTRGTAFSGVKPPAAKEVASIIAKARLMFPCVPIYLGCMRPGGRYRQALDLLAVRAGANKIVQPAASAAEEAKKLGLNITYAKGCCSL